MCGILVASGLNRPFSHRLLNGLRARGPDQVGFWADNDVQLAHTRLAIIGLDERGIEPLENETHVLSYNGEIYNFVEIRRRLVVEGIQVSDGNDAAVLLHAWSRWGAEVLTSLTGFWSFVVLDKRTRVLSLVRDQFGVKPLYYWHEGTSVCAASLIQTVLDAVGQPTELNYAALSEYVRYQFTFGDKTFLKQVRKVLPGHIVEIDLRRGTAQSRQYEDILSPANESVSAFTEEWTSDARKLLEKCVLDSTISDTSYTTFCSGGIDSSLITRIAKPETAYHCNFADPECNETFFAQTAVEGTPIRLFTVNAQEKFNLVERIRDIIRDFDEPTIGSVILPLDDLLRQVKRRYKVILTGTGGDELFAGYVRYQLALGHCYQDSYRALYGRMRSVKNLSDRFEMTHTKGEVSRYRFYEPSAQSRFRDAFDACHRGTSDLDAMLRFDRRYFLAGLLNIDDKMCGRHSLESRPSFLHQDFVRHIMRLDVTAFLRGNELKPILRDIAAPLLPAAIAKRTDKMGFTTPIGSFVNESAGFIREQIFDSPFRELYDLRGINFTAETKYSREVFGMLTLDLWLNRYATR
jgi:asparagine synthase (glutamine-hydrolysing)